MLGVGVRVGVPVCVGVGVCVGVWVGRGVKVGTSVLVGSAVGRGVAVSVGSWATGGGVGSAVVLVSPQATNSKSAKKAMTQRRRGEVAKWRGGEVAKWRSKLLSLRVTTSATLSTSRCPLRVSPRSIFSLITFHFSRFTCHAAVAPERRWPGKCRRSQPRARGPGENRPPCPE
jgi:hypothetical protein